MALRLMGICSRPLGAEGLFRSSTTFLLLAYGAEISRQGNGFEHGHILPRLAQQVATRPVNGTQHINNPGALYRHAVPGIDVDVQTGVAVIEQPQKIDVECHRSGGWSARCLRIFSLGTEQPAVDFAACNGYDGARLIINAACQGEKIQQRDAAKHRVNLRALHRPRHRD